MGTDRVKRWLQALAGLAVGVASSVVLMAAASGGESDLPQRPQVDSVASDFPARATQNELPCTQADQSANFRLFSLGESFEGLSLTAVLRTCEEPSGGPGPSPIGRNTVSYIYGDCRVEADYGCAPPIEVQISPACERSVADYDDTAPIKLEERRGVPSATFPNQIELYTDDATVVIFASNLSQAERVAAAVQPMSRDEAPATFPPETTPTENLPNPVAGAVDGQLRCDRSGTTDP